MFRRFCNPTSCFIPSLSTRPVGMETAFSIRLADQTPVMRGIGVVLDAWSDGNNQFGRPGILLGIKRLAADSLETFQRLVTPRSTRGSARDTIPQPQGSPTDKIPVQPVQPVQQELRTPGSSTVLPANPLTDMNDDSLEAFVECELREVETDETLTAKDFDFEGPLTLPNNPAPRPAIPTTLGVAPLTPVTVHAAPEPVKTELVDRVSSSLAIAPAEPEPRPWFAEFLRRWWLACAVALALISLVVVTTIWASNKASPTPPAPAFVDPPAPPTPPVTRPVQPEAAPVADPGPCKLTITTRPEGAHVKIDNEEVGVAPLTVASPCARRRVEAASPRWLSTSRWVVVESESTVEVTLTRPKHALKILSSPDGSTVSINGKRLGSTPITAEIAGWTNVTIVIEKAGFKTARQKHKSTKSRDEIFVRLAK